MFVAALLVYLAVGQVFAAPDNELFGKIAVVTGGAKGIGYAISDNFLEHKVKEVVIVDKNLTEGVRAVETLNSLYGPNKASFIPGDVTTDSDRIWEIIEQNYEHVDILVNNAGVVDEDDPIYTINTNTLAPILLSHKYNEMVRKDKGGKGGTIMNIASVAGYLRSPFFWSYKTSKYAIIGLTLCMGHEFNYQNTGVRILAIAPGFTYTDMTAQQMVIDEQLEVFTEFRKVMPWQTADDVGQAAVTLYKNGKTGVSYTIDGGELSESPDSSIITADELHDLMNSRNV